MRKKIATTWLLVSMVPFWIGLAVAEPPQSDPKAPPPAKVEASVAEKLKDRVPEKDGAELRGVVIDEIPKGSTLEKAGLLVGDVITAWKRLPNPPANPEVAEGVVASYFDWLELQVEQAPRGTVVLRGRRDGDPLELTVAPGLWETRARPFLPLALEALWEEGKTHLAAGDLEATVRAWQSLADDARGEDRGDLRAWVALRIGNTWGDKGKWGKTVEEDERALNLGASSMAQVAVWEDLGKAYRWDNKFELAEKAYSSALQLRRDRGSESLGAVITLSNMGELAWTRGDLNKAYSYLFQAKQIAEHSAPQSLVVAVSLNNLGSVMGARGDLDLAEGYYREALKIFDELAPNTPTQAYSLNSLGAVARTRGELDLAQAYQLKSFRIRESFSPGTLEMADSLTDLGNTARARGELERARAYYLQALKITRSLAPRSTEVATRLNNLGIVARDQGKLSQAIGYLRQALHILKAIAPRSLAIATTLTNLGLVAKDRGEFESATNLFSHALEIREQLAPQSFFVANSLHNLGAVARDRGQLDREQDYLSRALRIYESVAPQTLEVAKGLNDLAAIAKARGQLDRALPYYLRALDTLEHQVSRLGGSYNVQADFRSKRHDYYLDLLDLFLIQNRFLEAFQVLERFRAQTFLTMLAERDVAFTADIPVDLDRERRRVRVLYDRTQKKLAGLNPRDNAELIESTRKELQKLDDEAGDIEARIRSASPKLAALRYPQPLDAAAAQQALDPGTLLLSFSVGKEKTAVFALSRTGALEVKILPLGEKSLRSKVKLLLSLTPESRGGSALSKQRRTQLQAASRELYSALLGPLADRIATSERLLILPDGPLHALPFAALVRDTQDGPQYLGAWKPLHVALSATVYAELKQRRHPVSDQEPLQLAGFGDPVYPQNLAALKKASTDTLLADGALGTGRGDPTVRGAAERGLFDFQPLPYTRREVLGIANLFPAGTVRTFLGPEALEERIKGLAPKTRILHLAAHASIDEHLPSGSFIALTIPDETAPDGTGPQRDNGLLQVWEIFERVRLNADLVVLSACDSGLGEELGGEGLIGLTRAFQYAGARTVMASLWNVNDQATSELMIRFYKHLRASLSKDQALQAAQQELIAGPIEIINDKGERVLRDFTAPYYWAAFQIYGDWQ